VTPEGSRKVTPEGTTEMMDTDHSTQVSTTQVEPAGKLLAHWKEWAKKYAQVSGKFRQERQLSARYCFNQGEKQSKWRFNTF